MYYGAFIENRKIMMKGVNSSMTYLIYCKNNCKCHNVPPLNTTKNKKKKPEEEQP
jgi:hypothetical protein